MFDMVIRPIERTGKCRECYKTLNKGDMILYKYSSANKGIVIIFCLPCVEKIGKMYERWKHDKTL